MPQPEVDTKTKLMIGMYRPIIYGYAQKKVEPEQVAQMIMKRLESLSDDALLIMHDAMQSPTTKELWVYSFGPELREFDEWVDKVMAAMSKIIGDMFEEVPAQTDKAPEGAPDGAQEAQVEESQQSDTGEQK